MKRNIGLVCMIIGIIIAIVGFVILIANKNHNVKMFSIPFAGMVLAMIAGTIDTLKKNPRGKLNKEDSKFCYSSEEE